MEVDADNVHVIGGILRWDDQAGDYVPAPPMTARRFVARHLAGRLMWVSDVGGMLDPTADLPPATGPAGGPAARRRTTRPSAATATPPSRRLRAIRLPARDSPEPLPGWRPVPNRPGTPQISEAGRIAIPDGLTAGEYARMADVYRALASGRHEDHCDHQAACCDRLAQAAEQP